MDSFPEVKFKLSEEKTTKDSGIKQFLFTVNSKKGKEKFEKFFSELLEDDCWGLKIGEEIIFNLYKENTWNEIIDINIKREQLVKLPNSILSRIYFQEMKGFKIEFYMAKGPTRKIVLTYNGESWVLDYYIEKEDFV